MPTLYRVVRAIAVLTARRVGPWLSRSRYVALAVGAGACGVAALNLADTPRPAQRYGAADLPAAPPKWQNGFVDVLALGPVTRTPNPAARAVVEGRRTLGSAHDALAAEPPLADQRFISSCVTAISRPRFADVCVPGEVCRSLAVLACSRAVEEEALRAAVRHDGERATALTEHLARATADHLATARSLVSFLVAVEDATEVLRLSVIVRSRAALGFFPTDLPERPAALAGDYLAAVAAVDDAARGDHGFMSRMTLDPGATIAALNERFDGGWPRPEDNGRSRLWWLDNATGKALLGGLPSQHIVASRMAGYHEARAAAAVALNN